ncbi:MAG: amidohydrolase [Henriciella sp.]|jgi:predicted TIM-barrel fold metal-dependent hydrolase|uniref:amidohydrolase family protein n=1 Tax=Henriciella sp. TaxID=1968823 RepID=UPI000C0F93C7|nr:amidohydrolase family protein [Henriciella sp.]MAN73567.1 amidohydrolase [Henriciella sp.]MBF34736.1 amidohydrolase [Hyphomonadaceae bacterium]PHR75442.1 MAG: amidohydrolase [Henriciella sp.]|tara:strand:- start:1746 stop:2762 length:1017 start_codon:yes stop_codon:yes gene_type:complete
MFDNNDWLNRQREEVIDRDREIVDPHHHLWPKTHPVIIYDLEDLWGDTGDGHNVTQTIFMECGAAYREDGPDHLKPVGESEYIAEAARKSRSSCGQATIAAMVAHADLRLPLKTLDEVLDAHIEASEGLFRGIRHAGPYDPASADFLISPRGPEGLYHDPDFRRGVAHLGARGFTYDTWNYHHQILEFRDLAAAVPETTMILDHFGTPLGVGPYAGKREDNFEKWKDDIAAVAEQKNVFAKLGGLAMPDNGFGWHERDRPPSSDEFVDAQAKYYHHTIACFGAERCMLESNFPVDRLSISFRTLWNGLKKITADYSEEEKSALFAGTARKVYSVAPPV